MYLLTFLFASVFTALALASASAESGTSSTSLSSSKESNLPTYFVEGIGTHFEISGIGIGYLNVTLRSTEFVHVLLEVGPRMVSYSIQSLSSANSTVLTLSGLEPSKTYYRYQDGDLANSFTTDSAGSYGYVQGILGPHLIFISERVSTVYIYPDGSVHPETAPIQFVGSIYTLTADIYEPIVVEKNDIIIDGNGHTLQGPGSGYGILVYNRDNVTIRNIKITQFWLGIYLWSTNNSRIESVMVTKGVGLDARGIAVYLSNDNVILGNTATENDWGGIFLLSSDGNTILCNNATNNKYMGIWVYRSRYNIVSLNNATNNGNTGIGLNFSSDNIISRNNVANNGYEWSRGGIWLLWLGGNTISNNNVTNNYCGILAWSSDDNTIYHNNFISNLYQVDNWATVNAWDDGYPSGGNYWSDYVGTDIYSGPDQNQTGGDGIGDAYYTKWTIVDHYPFVHEGGWEKYFLKIETEPLGLTTIPGEGWYTLDTDILLTAPPIVPNSTGVQYRFDHWTVDGNVVSGNPIAVQMSGPLIVKASYIKQYYLTVVSSHDTTSGEGWYDEDKTAYAILHAGLEYSGGATYGFVGWGGDAKGLDLISDQISMNAPKTAMANWEQSTVYGAVKEIGFWKRQVSFWYLTELAKSGMKIKVAGTAQVSEDELITYLKYINDNSRYFLNIVVYNSEGVIDSLATLQNANVILWKPVSPQDVRTQVEQQLFTVWLNLARKAFFWNTQLSQATQYVYSRYNFGGGYGLITIGEAIEFCEFELNQVNGNYKAAKAICVSINNNLGIVWGT